VDLCAEGVWLVSVSSSGLSSWCRCMVRVLLVLCTIWFQLLVCASLFSGGDLVLGSCLSSVNNICRDSIEEEALGDFEALRSGLNGYVGMLGSTEASSMKVLVEFSSPHPEREGYLSRVWAMPARISGNPKFQMWVPCLFPDRNNKDPGDLDIGYPYEVDLRLASHRLNSDKMALEAWTSDELTDKLLSVSKVWSMQRVAFTIPHRSSLLVNLVQGTTGPKVPLVKEKRKAVNISREVAELGGGKATRNIKQATQDRLQQTMFQAPPRNASSATASSSSRALAGPSSRSSAAPSTSTSVAAKRRLPEEEVATACVGESQLAEMPFEAISEMAAALGLEDEEQPADESGSSEEEAEEAGEVATVAATSTVGPSAGGSAVQPSPVDSVAAGLASGDTN